MPAGSKPPVLQQAKLKAAKKDATKEKKEEDADIAEGDKELQEPLKAPKLEEEDAVMAETPEAEEEVGLGGKQGGEKPAVKDGGCRPFLPFLPRR